MTKTTIKAVALLVMALVTAIAAAAYHGQEEAAAQQHQQQQQADGQQAAVSGPSQDIEVIDSERVRAQVSQFIGATRLINYTLYDDGKAIYVFEFVGLPQFLRGNATTNPIQSDMIEVHTTHGFTAANGYTFDAATGSILTPEGKRLVIETFEPTVS